MIPAEICTRAVQTTNNKAGTEDVLRATTTRGRHESTHAVYTLQLKVGHRVTDKARAARVENPLMCQQKREMFDIWNFLDFAVENRGHGIAHLKELSKKVKVL